MTLTARDRDIIARTILGEALNQPPEGQAAVAWTIRNRTADPRWGGSPSDVALAPQQFSAWNAVGRGGNRLVNVRSGPAYDQAAAIADAVFNDQIPDPTNGAVYYGNIPAARAGWGSFLSSQGNLTRIGDHTFAGMVGGNGLPSSVVREGDQGPSVGTLQQQLAAAGFDPGPIDQQFGPLTRAAVEAYQAASGLGVDGVAGPQTLASVNSQPPSTAIAGTGAPQGIASAYAAASSLPALQAANLEAMGAAGIGNQQGPLAFLPSTTASPAGIEADYLAKLSAPPVAAPRSSPDISRIADYGPWRSTTPTATQAPVASSSQGEDLTVGGIAPRTGTATLIEPSTVPAGPYGADAVVKAAMTGDMGSLQKAMSDTQKLAATAVFGDQKVPVDKVKSALQGYLDSLVSVAPGAVRQVEQALTNNPKMQGMLGPIQSQINKAVAALPSLSSLTRTMPIPQPRLSMNAPVAVASNSNSWMPASSTSYHPTASSVRAAVSPSNYGQPGYSGIESFRSPARTAYHPTAASVATSAPSVTSSPSNYGQAGYSGVDTFRSPVQTRPLAFLPSATPTTVPAPTKTLSFDTENQLQNMTGARVPTVDEYLKTAMLTPPKIAQPVPIVPTVIKKTIVPDQYQAATGLTQPQSRSYTTPSGQSYDMSEGSHGSYVVSNGVIQSPSEYVSSLGGGGAHYWKRGGRLVPYKPVR